MSWRSKRSWKRSESRHRTSSEPGFLRAGIPLERRTVLNNLVNIGYGNMVMSSKVVAILSPESAPMRRLKDEAREQKMLIDATQGRKTRAIIITDSDHVILSAVQVETLMQRFAGRGE